MICELPLKSAFGNYDSRLLRTGQTAFPARIQLELILGDSAPIEILFRPKAFVSFQPVRERSECS